MNDAISIQRTKEKLSHLITLLGNAIGMPEQAAAYAEQLPERLDECIAGFTNSLPAGAESQEVTAAALRQVTEPLLDWLLIGLAVDLGRKEVKRGPRATRGAAGAS
jgi:hypothetical protein